MIWVKKYDNIKLLGDFNIDAEEKNMSNYQGSYHLKILSNERAVSKTQAHLPVST